VDLKYFSSSKIIYFIFFLLCIFSVHFSTSSTHKVYFIFAHIAFRCHSHSSTASLLLSSSLLPNSSFFSSPPPCSWKTKVGEMAASSSSK